MENKLKNYLEEAFKPYGDFPAHDDVVEELHANLVEKYNDNVAEGMNEHQAYRSTIESLGDVAEIMEQVTPDKNEKIAKGEPLVKKATSLLRSMYFKEADLSDSSLIGADL